MDVRAWVDVHKVANWRLPGAITCAWASKELGSGLQGCEGGRGEARGGQGGWEWEGMEWDESVSTRHDERG